ncbi:PREDICTED: epithelial cell-transforming sequence 2 oncogene-like [Thamnophis sirtalis]|uniref:Epithelial cell-transforming sequence 2 oncogene-like n=1 Tax=Thamnophis sirtalis TaxID=35019 RepID=A0A6I9Y286_9SAUR|nr:PREDICTED: epithelial cell-transforming sequence 2 oncogene-like [Thamnophis sirtalis]
MEILHTRFSSWTPIENKSLNNQLYQERIRLVSHWFDLWTDKQRKQFLFLILNQCNKSQLKCVEKWLVENIPLTHVDFTTLLPRFISLYIFSFLSPRELCAAAQINWHWKFLTEQDCLWMPKCLRLGWFLPYVPEKNEYGTWKRYYIACATSLEYLTPRRIAYHSTTSDLKTKIEEQEERWQAKCLTKFIRGELAVCKKELFKARPPWISGTRSSGFYKSGFPPDLSQSVYDKAKLSAKLLMKNKSASGFRLEAEKPFILSPGKSLPERRNITGSSSCPNLSHRFCQPVSQGYPNGMHSLHPHLVLISSHLPAYEMIVDSVKLGVVLVVYEHTGTTLESLIHSVERVLDGQIAKSIGIISDGDSREINLLQGYNINAPNLLKPEVREFWKRLKSCIISPEEGGSIDLFVPLAASEAGKEILSQLTHLTGAFFRTPTGIATGSYQHILSEWLGHQKESPPPFLYLTEVKLQIWLRFTELLEEALDVVRQKLNPYFFDLQKNMAGKILGQIMFNTMSWSNIQDNEGIIQILANGLVELSRGNHIDEPQDVIEKRQSFARELLLSERNYVHILEIVKDVYVKPLKAALASHQAILSDISIPLIFSDVLDILQVNSEKQDRKLDISDQEQLGRFPNESINTKVNAWSPAQNVGDIFIKLGQQFQTYANFFNNYAVILKTIDKCQETIPVFRAFLKTHDRTVVTTMRSLQELLLCPAKRVKEYITLLCALRLHTPQEHTDHEDLATAIKQMKQLSAYIDQLKLNVDRNDQLLSVQQCIQGGPQLLKASRYLIMVQDVAQLNCSQRMNLPFRLYEHTHDLRLFLFNDILVISQCNISYKPFERIPKVTYQFLTTIMLHQLQIEDIPDSKYIKNALLLQGPKQQWICSTDEDKFGWFSALQKAIHCSISEHVN